MSRPQEPTGQPPPASTPAAELTVAGAPAPLATLLGSFYAGKPVAASPVVQPVLTRRSALARPLAATAEIGSWQRQPYAVVTAGDDVTLAVAGPDDTWHVAGGWWPSLGVTEHVLGAGPRLLLVAGSDARPGQDVARSRADSLHIVGMDGRGGGGILGIARDSYVPLTTGGRGKINAALALGGPDALLATVRSATGVPVEGYLLTGFDGFTKIIDGLGGLRISLRSAVSLGEGASVPSGASTLTGDRALALARERHTVAGGDFGRSANQGTILLAVGATAALGGPAVVPDILAVLDPHVATDLGAEQLLTFVLGGYSMNLDRVGRHVAAGTVATTATGESIVVWDAQATGYFADLRDGNLQ